MSKSARAATIFLALTLLAVSAFAAPTADVPIDVSLGKWLDATVDQGSIALSLLVAFLAGVVVSLSPCVYPLIPITIAVFGARQETSYVRSFLLSLSYVVGMALFYSTIAVIFSLLGLASGSLMAMPVVVLSIAGLGVLMAASLLGAFELVIPSSLQTRLSSVGGSGYKGAFLMGLVAGVIAAPCAGPVLVFILALIAKEGSLVFGTALMLAYAFGIGLLFLLLGTFSQLIARMPKSGGWMETARSVLGIGMLLASLYIAAPHLAIVKHFMELPWSQVYVLAAVAAILVGAALGALHLSFHHGGTLQAVRKGVGVVLCSAGLLGLIAAAENSPATSNKQAPIVWLNSHDEALALAQQQHKPVMIDFGAEWCQACKELDKYSFADAAVRIEAQRFVAVKVDCTELDDNVTALWQRYGIKGLPQVVFIDSKAQVLQDPRVTTFLPAAPLLEEMRKVR